MSCRAPGGRGVSGSGPPADGPAPEMGFGDATIPVWACRGWPGRAAGAPGYTTEPRRVSSGTECRAICYLWKLPNDYGRTSGRPRQEVSSVYSGYAPQRAPILVEGSRPAAKRGTEAGRRPAQIPAWEEHSMMPTVRRRPDQTSVPASEQEDQVGSHTATAP